jgi:CRP-like cAMP-binding protein
MNEPYAETITKFPLFEGHTTQGAQFVLDRGEVREHAPGELLCREGEAATFVLLVLSGQVQVFVERQGRTLVLAEAGPGTILGELAVLCGIPRTAALRASEKLVALHWSNEAFRRMLLSNASLSERILRQSMRTLIEKEQGLIDSLCRGSDSQVGSTGRSQ